MLIKSSLLRPTHIETGHVARPIFHHAGQNSHVTYRFRSHESKRLAQFRVLSLLVIMYLFHGLYCIRTAHHKPDHGSWKGMPR